MEDMIDYVKVPRDKIGALRTAVDREFNAPVATYIAAQQLFATVDAEAYADMFMPLSMTTGHSEPGSRWEGIPDRSLSFSDSPPQWVLLTEEEADRLVLAGEPCPCKSAEWRTGFGIGYWSWRSPGDTNRAYPASTNCPDCHEPLPPAPSSAMEEPECKAWLDERGRRSVREDPATRKGPGGWRAALYERDTMGIVIACVREQLTELAALRALVDAVRMEEDSE